MVVIDILSDSRSLMKLVVVCEASTVSVLASASMVGIEGDTISAELELVGRDASRSKCIGPRAILGECWKGRSEMGDWTPIRAVSVIPATGGPYGVVEDMFVSRSAIRILFCLSSSKSGSKQV